MVVPSWTRTASMPMPQPTLRLCHCLRRRNLTQNFIKLCQIKAILLQLILNILGCLATHTLVLLTLQLLIKLLLSQANIHGRIPNGTWLWLVSMPFWYLLSVSNICRIKCFHLITEIHQDALYHILRCLRRRCCAATGWWQRHNLLLVQYLWRLVTVLLIKVWVLAELFKGLDEVVEVFHVLFDLLAWVLVWLLGIHLIWPRLNPVGLLYTLTSTCSWVGVLVLRASELLLSTHDLVDLCLILPIRRNA